MLTLLLALLVVALAVVGAEFVRATCRRQLMSPTAGHPQLGRTRVE